MTTFDLIEDPTYGDNDLTISTDSQPRNRFRWGVYHHGRLLHGGLSTPNEAELVRRWYLDGIPASDPRWKLITNPIKQPSPGTDHRLKAGYLRCRRCHATNPPERQKCDNCKKPLA